MKTVSLIILLLLLQPQFTGQTIDTSIEIGYGLAVGDVDGDGRPDILLADKSQIVWYRNGDWKKFVIVENLTKSDNVCLAARDIDGDGKVEVAVGAQWNPSETSDTTKSGAVFFLERPQDPTGKWGAVRLHHEPTVHRMRWVQTAPEEFELVVLPLHGRGNSNGEGAGVRVLAYKRPETPNGNWQYRLIDQSMHLTHNLDVIPEGKAEAILVGGKEGIKKFGVVNGKWTQITGPRTFINDQSFGELRAGNIRRENGFIAGIQPMHGNELTVYQWRNENNPERAIITSDLKQGHALAAANLSGDNHDEIVAGWREPNEDGKIGIRIFSFNARSKQWSGEWLDENGIACEDLIVEDLNHDGKKDIIACGRATKNVKIYWQR